MTEPTKYLLTTDLSLSSPRGLCVDTDLNRLLICDTSNNKLNLVNIVGNASVTSTTTYNKGQTTLSGPQDACYYDGHFYVCDTGNHAVIRLRADDLTYKDHFGTIGTSGNTTITLKTPNGICHNKEYLFVCDGGNNRIMKLTLETLAYSTNEGDYNSTTLSGAVGICFQGHSGDRALFITDAGNTRVVKCKTDFTYIDAISSVTYNHGTVVDDKLHMCDGVNNSILIYDTASLTLRETLTSATANVDEPYGITSYRDTIIFSGKTDGYIHSWRRYNPRDALTQASAMKFGGDLYDNPLIIGDDTLIAGATAESGTPNRWKEENSLCEVGWVEE